MQSIHGSFSITTQGVVTRVVARGPWNEEFVLSFMDEYRKLIELRSGSAWYDIIIAEGESLFIPEAEVTLSKAMEVAYASGLECSAIVLGSSVVAQSAQHQFQRMLEGAEIPHAFFDTEAQAITWLESMGMAA